MIRKILGLLLGAKFLLFIKPNLKVAIKNLDRFDYQKNLMEYYNLVKSLI